VKRIRRYRTLRVSTTREQIGRHTRRIQLHENKMSDGNNHEIRGNGSENPNSNSDKEQGNDPG
jgi:hypothetical protein